MLYKFRKSSIRKKRVCFKYFVGISSKKEKKKKEKKGKLNKCRKRVVFKNCSEVFRDNNHQKFCTRILNSIMTLNRIPDQ